MEADEQSHGEWSPQRSGGNGDLLVLEIETRRSENKKKVLRFLRFSVVKVVSVASDPSVASCLTKSSSTSGTLEIPMRVLNTQQMREADRRTIDDVGIPSIVLMENAGRQAVAAMEAAFDDLLSSRVGVLCGRGNNGGDGFVIARTLIAAWRRRRRCSCSAASRTCAATRARTSRCSGASV